MRHLPKTAAAWPIPHVTAANFLNTYLVAYGLAPLSIGIEPEAAPKNNPSFVASLRVPVPADPSGREIVVQGRGRSHADAKVSARIEAVTRLVGVLHDKSVPPALRKRLDEIELATEGGSPPEQVARTFADFDGAVVFLVRLFCFLKARFPVAVAVPWLDGQFKASIRCKLPPSVSLGGREASMAGVGFGADSASAKRLAKIDLADRLFLQVSNPARFLGQSRPEEGSEPVERLPIASFQLTEDGKLQVRDFLDRYKEAFVQPEAESVLPGSRAGFSFKPVPQWPVLSRYPKSELPIHARFNEIMDFIDRHDVTLITGATGCGKTTQIPQFVLYKFKRFLAERSRQEPPGTAVAPRIIMTQPRRIAAIAAASRISHELGEQPGGSVGYSVRFDSVKPSEFAGGSVLVCTTGILLRRLVHDPYLADCSHLIVDEVHERDEITDMLLLSIRAILKARRGSLKVILMSATAVAGNLASYLSVDGITVGVPPELGGTLFAVRDRFLEEIRDGLAGGAFPLPADLEEESSLFCENELAGNHLAEGAAVPHALIYKLILKICQSEPAGSVLVFLPGIEDLNFVRNLLLKQTAVDFSSPNPAGKLFLLHSGLGISPDVAGELFVHAAAPPTYRKVILTTNVAESSVTVPDAVYVIDSGRHRLLRYDHSKRMNVLCTEWISRASAKQRRGRAGRCRPGNYYFLGASSRYDRLPASHPPEMTRTCLDGAVLSVKRLFPREDLRLKFAELIDPPPSAHLNDAIQKLRWLGALDDAENVTPLGSAMSCFPADPSLAKVAVLSTVFGCVDPIVSIAALSGERIFQLGFTDEERQKLSQTVFSYHSRTKRQHPFSDHLNCYSILSDFERLSGEHERRLFCNNHGLVHGNLRRASSIKGTYLSILGELGFCCNGRSHNLNSGNTHLIRTVLLLGLYPNVAFRSVARKNFFRTKSINYASIPGHSCNAQLSDTRRETLRAAIGDEPFSGTKETDLPALYLFGSVMDAGGRPVLSQTTAVSPLSLLLASRCAAVASDRGAGHAAVVDGWLPVRGDRESLLLSSGLSEVVDRYASFSLATGTTDESFLARLGTLVGKLALFK